MKYFCPLWRVIQAYSGNEIENRLVDLNSTSHLLLAICFKIQQKYSFNFNKFFHIHQKYSFNFNKFIHIQQKYSFNFNKFIHIQQKYSFNFNNFFYSTKIFIQELPWCCSVSRCYCFHLDENFEKLIFSPPFERLPSARYAG